MIIRQFFLMEAQKALLLALGWLKEWQYLDYFLEQLQPRVVSWPIMLVSS
jgi:hypothetical protein